ncbi:MAG: hypothetical protein RMA76_34510 [Deltaproteobacteria bacterium]|jgi:hypothetical protein
MSEETQDLRNVTFQLDNELLHAFKTLCASQRVSMRARLEYFIMVDLTQSGHHTPQEIERFWTLATAALRTRPPQGDEAP